MLTLVLLGLTGVAFLYLGFRHSERDAVTLLTVWLVLLWGMSARWVVEPLGAVGQPATILGAAFLLLWVGLRLWGHPGVLAPGIQPVRMGAGLYLAVVALSYAFAQTRLMTELEATGSDRALIGLAGLVGVTLLAADGISSRSRLEALVSRVVLAASAVSFLAVLHFFTGLDLVPHLRLPGLSASHGVHGAGGVRSLFVQPQATARHPIELGVILAMVLPLAIHRARYATGRGVRLRWVVVGLISVGIPLSVSRSGMLAVAIALGVLALSWSWRWRLNAVVYSMGLVAVMWVVVPGLVGTIRSLFLGMDTDPSVLARRERVPRVIELLQENPVLGLGPGTFTPEDYFLLDNQYYATLMELGWPGVFALLVMLGSGIGAGLLAKRGMDEQTRHLAQALIAGLATVPICMATFDAFFFRIFAGTTFLYLGVLGALWRISRVEGTDAAIATTGSVTAPATNDP